MESLGHINRVERGCYPGEQGKQNIITEKLLQATAFFVRNQPAQTLIPFYLFLAGRVGFYWPSSGEV